MQQLKSLKKFFDRNIFPLSLLFITSAFFLVNWKMNQFRYDNFDFGKFDLGNMAQMLWYTLHGKFLYLTDYFGTNLPRWSMSHVDPIILLILPIFFFFQNAMTLVYVQVFTVLFSSFLVYYIGLQRLENKLASFLLAVAYLFFPALGYLTAWTGYHGVTFAIPFFFACFFWFEHLYFKKDFSTKNLIIFWILALITMTGKEQIPLYFVLFGFYIALFRQKIKLGLSLSLVSVIWFIIAFFVIIPYYAPYRVVGYEKFSQSLNIDVSDATDVSNDNYFLSRYGEFGDDYQSIVFGMLFNPVRVVQVFFGGDKLDNFKKTLEPVAYLPFAYPPIFVFALPDMAINYLTTSGGIGTAEITNHRVSMLVPVIFISTIYSIWYIGSRISKLKIKFITYANLVVLLALLVLGMNIYTSDKFNNPVYLWVKQAVQKRIVFAKEDIKTAQKQQNIGDVVTLSDLENKDRVCAQKVVEMIPADASVSGPDYLGAHLGLRETYAIFPALFNEADYVIVDVFSQKLLRILDLDPYLVRSIVGLIIRDPRYDMVNSCGNLFVFKLNKSYVETSDPDETHLLPIQEVFEYKEKYDYPFYSELHIVDFNSPTEVKRGDSETYTIAYHPLSSNKLEKYIMFMTFINKKTGELFQVANLPSFALMQPDDWVGGNYYIEQTQVVLPTYLDSGDYKVYIGMTNRLKTRSMYLADIKVY